MTFLTFLMILGAKVYYHNARFQHSEGLRTALHQLTAQEFEQICLDTKITFKYLPSYSSDCNTIEETFEELKIWINKNYILADVYNILRKSNCSTWIKYQTIIFDDIQSLLYHIVALHSRVLEFNYINTQFTHISLSLRFPESLDLYPQMDLNPGFGW